MGVDCTAYETVTLVEERTVLSMSDDDWDAVSEAGNLFLFNLQQFKDRGDGLADGIYRPSGRTLRWSSTYTGYGEFRRALSRSALGVDPEIVWDDYAAYEARPFAPLICFADSEGFLGPKTCERLSADAAAPFPSPHHQDAWDDWCATPGYEGTWARWREMFDLAAGTGVIRYS